MLCFFVFGSNKKNFMKITVFSMKAHVTHIAFLQKAEVSFTWKILKALLKARSRSQETQNKQNKNTTKPQKTLSWFFKSRVFSNPA